ncbi:LytR/AlgR family response regulator transcription factor [Saccharicrinis sp. FJH54]|uniref:LytR/AlgR family response regulator transcription factor n=1 Tax=Saccharicrinis sp. FJH54 TaxID=3344665 RepID=UPI0035D40F95
MNVLILEDEVHSANMLIKLLEQYDPEIGIADIIGSVEKGIQWFKTHPLPDLIFQDIRLSDGDCFSIYEAVQVPTPVIFTTAYSSYAIQSFRVNNIDYLLKPYDYSDLKKAIDKFKAVQAYHTPVENKLLREIVSGKKPIPRQRILVKTGDNFKTVRCSDLVCFYSEDGLSFALTADNKSLIVDESLSTLENQLDEAQFFRINRKFIVNIDHIIKITQWFNNRLKLQLSTHSDEDILVSRERVTSFKTWLNQ